MRREGGARGGGRRAALRCGRRGLAGHHGEADPAGAQLRGPGECGDAGGAVPPQPPPPGPRAAGLPAPGRGTESGRARTAQLLELGPGVPSPAVYAVAEGFPSTIAGGAPHGQVSALKYSGAGFQSFTGCLRY